MNGDDPQGKPDIQQREYDDCAHHWIAKGTLFFHEGTKPILNLSTETLYRVHHCEMCGSMRHIAEGNKPVEMQPIAIKRISIKGGLVS